MAAPEPPIGDVVVTWLGAAGVLAYLRYIAERRTKSWLERTTLLLLGCLAALFAIRGFYWLLGHRWLGVLTFVPATLSPLAATLFTEALLRRHMPRAVKLFVAAGTLVFVALNVAGRLADSPGALTAFVTFTVVVLATLAGILLARDRASLSPAENRLIDALLVTALVSVPLAASDFRTLFPWVPGRMGALAGLVVVYVCVRVDDRRDPLRAVPVELFAVAAGGGLAAAGFAVIFGTPGVGRVAEAVPAATAMVLLLVVLGRLRAQRQDARETPFAEWLLGADTRSLDAFLESLRAVPLGEEMLVLRPAELAGYDTDALARRCGRDGGLLGRAAIQAGLAARREPDVEGAEQLLDVLGRYGMSHVALVRGNPCVLLLLNVPDVAGRALPDRELRLVRKTAELLDAASPTHV